MEVEVIALYLSTISKEGTYYGTMHIYLPKWDLDIRGCEWSLKGNSFHFRLPHSQLWSGEERKMMRFPVVSFASDHNKREFLYALKPIAKLEVEAFLKTRDA